MPIIGPSPGAAFIEGRRARQQEDFGNTRNALASLELQNAPQEIQSRNKLLDLQVKSAERQYSQQQISEALGKTIAASKRIAQSQNPRAELQQAYPEFAETLRKQNPDLDRMSDDDLRDYLGWIAGQAESKLGIAPPVRVNTIQTENGGILQEDPSTGALKQVTAPQRPDHFAEAEAGRNARAAATRERVGAQFSPMSPQEIAESGLPAGTSAQRNVATGEVKVISRPSATDQKAAREIKAKQPRLAAAGRRIERLATALDNIAGNKVFDGGPIDAKALRFTKQGQEVVQAQASLLPELTSLTRIPGIGSQSDLETRLQNLQLPSLEFDPEVNRRAIQELRTFIADLGEAYSVAAGGEPAKAPGQSVQNTQGSEVRVSSVQEAQALPPGTIFITPDGRRKRR